MLFCYPVPTSCAIIVGIVLQLARHYFDSRSVIERCFAVCSSGKPAPWFRTAVAVLAVSRVTLTPQTTSPVAFYTDQGERYDTAVGVYVVFLLFTLVTALCVDSDPDRERCRRGAWGLSTSWQSAKRARLICSMSPELVHVSGAEFNPLVLYCTGRLIWL